MPRWLTPFYYRHITRQTGRKDFLTAIMGAKESAQLGPAEIFSNMLLLL